MCRSHHGAPLIESGGGAVHDVNAHELVAVRLYSATTKARRIRCDAGDDGLRLMEACVVSGAHPPVGRGRMGSLEKWRTHPSSLVTRSTCSTAPPPGR